MADSGLLTNSEEAKLITKQLLREMLRKSEKQEDLEVLDIKIGPLTKPGENLMSAIFRVTVTTRDDTGFTKQHHLVIKTTFKAEGKEEFNEYIKGESLFYKESKAYTDIFPEMMGGRRKDCTVPLSIPEYIGHVLDEDKSIIVMKDLGQEGYTKADFTTIEGLDLQHSELVLKAMASFHALGFALKEKAPNEKIEDISENNFFSKANIARFKKPFQSCLECVAELVKASNLDENIAQEADKLNEFDILPVIRRCTTAEEPFATIIMSDCTSRNMLFKYDEIGAPKDVKLLDFQMIQYASPVFDIAFYLYSCTTDVFNDDRLQHLLKLYHSTLMENLAKLGIVSEFTYSKCYEDFVKLRAFSIAHGLFCLPFLLMRPEDWPMEVLSNPDLPGLSVLVMQCLERNGHGPRILEMFRIAVEDGLLT